MSGFRLPASLVPASQPPESGLMMLEHEVMAEKAASLGRAGEKAAACLARLKASPPDSSDRAVLVKAAAAAVHGFFIQRELCGMRRHTEIVRELAIPREVMVRLGAS